MKSYENDEFRQFIFLGKKVEIVVEWFLISWKRTHEAVTSFALVTRSCILLSTTDSLNSTWEDGSFLNHA